MTAISSCTVTSAIGMDRGTIFFCRHCGASGMVAEKAMVRKKYSNHQRVVLEQADALIENKHRAPAQNLKEEHMK